MTAREAYVHRRDRWHVRAGERALYWLFRAFRGATWRVPLWRLEKGLAAAGAWAILRVPGPRERIRGNAAIVYPDWPQDRVDALARETARQFCRLGIEYCHIERFQAEVAIAVEGAEHLARARDEGRPILLVTAHYGNWEAARLAARRAGVDCGILYRAFNNRPFDAFALPRIEELGRPVVQKGRAGLRALRDRLAEGGAMMILIDQRNTGAAMIPFLGQPAETATVPASLALRTGAAMIPVIARREVEARRFRVIFAEPIAEGPPEAMMTAANDRLSTWIHEEPGQWFWFHRRWRVRGGKGG